MHSRKGGFTLLEMVVAMAVMLVIMAAVMSFYKQSSEVSKLVVQRSEMQSELRAGLDQLSRDLEQAGTGIPQGGISIPSASSGGTNPKFGCDATPTCYVSTTGNTFTGGQLYKVTPGYNLGANIAETSDAIVITYLDPNLDWTAYPTQTAATNGTTITMPPGTTPPLNDPQYGLNLGDLLLIQAAGGGTAVGEVTAFTTSPANTITFAANDPLNFNQPTAPTGNIKALAFNPLPGSPPFYPSLTVSRIYMITYFLQPYTTPDGAQSRLMRQVNGRTPTPVADNIADLKFSYDLFDTSTGTLTAGLTNPTTPNQIKKINVLTITARSPRRNAQGSYDYVSYSTMIAPRNLSFTNRYQ